MTTIPGGVIIPTSGLTQQENQQIADLLNNQFGSKGKIETQQLAPSFADSKTNLTTPVFFGGSSVSTVNSVVVTPTASTGGSVLATVNVSAISTSSGANAVTNVVIQPGADSVVLSGTATGSTTAVFLPSSNTGNTLVVGDIGDNFVVGNGSANLTVLTGTGNDSVIGGSGVNDIAIGVSGVINAGRSTLANTLVGGTGSTTIGGGGGGDLVVAGSGGGVFIGDQGNDTLKGGAGSDVFVYRPGDGNDSIVGFDPTKDTLGIAGTDFGGGKTLNLASLISTAQVSGGNTILTLPDGSTITVAGATGINLSWFTVK